MVSLSRKTLRAAQVALQRCRPIPRTGKRRIIIPRTEKSSIAQFAPEGLLSDFRTGCSMSTGQAVPRHRNNRLYLADIIISAKSRRLGFGKAGLLLLCEAAKNEKIPELYDNIAIDNPGISLFFQCGFEEEYRTEEIIMLKKTL